jgi:queuine tRNA-ribosyltransferase
MLAATLASIHNLHFILRLVEKIRVSILEENFHVYKEEFLKKYYSK